MEAHVPGMVVFRDREGLKVAQLMVPTGDSDIGLEEVPAAGSTLSASANGVTVELALRSRDSREWQVRGVLCYHRILGPDSWRQLLRSSRRGSLPWEGDPEWQCPVGQVVAAEDAAQMFLNSIWLPGDLVSGQNGNAVRGLTLARLYYEEIGKTGSGRVAAAAVSGAGVVGKLKRALHNSEVIQEAVDALVQKISARLTQRQNGLVLLHGSSVIGEGFCLVEGCMSGLDVRGSIDWKQGDFLGFAGVYECIAAEVASIAQRVLGDDVRISAAQQTADMEFSRRLKRRRALSGVDEFWAYSVRRGVGVKDEVWLEMRVPPFLLEIETGEVLDYTEQPARVLLRLGTDTYYPQYYLHELFVHAANRKSQRAWQYFPNVSEWDKSTRTGFLCCHIKPGENVEGFRDRDAPVGGLLRALVEAAHDAVLLGYKASNTETVHRRPSDALEYARDNGRPVPYVVRGHEEALAREQNGSLFVRYAR